MRLFEIEERFANNKQLETERKISKHVFFKNITVSKLCVRSLMLETFFSQILMISNFHCFQIFTCFFHTKSFTSGIMCTNFYQL